MRCKKSIKAVLCLTFAFILLAQPFSFIPAGAQSASEIQQEINDLKAQQAEIEKQIDALKDDQERQEDYRAELQRQIDNTQYQIDACNRQIAAYDAEIAAHEAEIEVKNQEIESTKTLFKKRVRAIVMSGGDSASLTLLLNASDFSDFLTKTELTRSVSAYDNAIIDKILDAIKEIQAVEEDIRAKQDEQAAIRRELAAKQQELSSQVYNINVVIDSISANVDAQEAKLEEVRAAREAAEAAFYAAAAGGAYGNVIYSGGAFAWPLPGYYMLSSYYGGRYWDDGSYEFHKGIDISGGGVYGKPVIAAADGVVSAAWPTASSGGYGNCVMINHGNDQNGNNISTLYAHMAYYVVGSGQSVSKGQVIGYVGSTGWSTGPHLHFEVRINGATTDPLAYFN